MMKNNKREIDDAIEDFEELKGVSKRYHDYHDNYCRTTTATTTLSTP